MREVEISENLTKFIFNKSQFSPAKKRVKYPVFMPPPNRRLSVFRISDLSEHKVWEIGNEVGALRELSVLARADVTVSSVRESGLDIDADCNPPRHANIIGWPENPSAIKLRAIELADAADLVIK